MKRHNQILVSILVIQIALSVVVFWPKSAVTAESEPLFPDLVTAVVALTITDADGNSIALRQVAGDWVLPDADDYLAKADKITPLLEEIVGLTTGRLVTRTDASHKRLQVASDDFVRRIEFETADGTKHTLYLGSSPSYGAIHFRLDGQSEVYLTNDMSTWEINGTAASWIDTVYLSVPQADVTRMTLENANGTFTFTKDDEGNGSTETSPSSAEALGEVWTMAGLAADEILDQTKVTTLLQRAASVNMASPLGKEDLVAYGMDQPNAVVTLETDDKTITLRVGAKDLADNSYVVISSESPYHVRVSEYSVKILVENARDDFLLMPPTPTPEGEEGNTDAP